MPYVCLSSPAVNNDPDVEVARRILGSVSWIGRSDDLSTEETSACDKGSEALAGTIEVLNVELPPTLRWVENLLDLLDTGDKKILAGPPACSGLDAAASEGNELVVVDPLVVEWPSCVAEDAEYAAVLLSAPLLGVLESRFVLLSLKAREVAEIDDAPDFKDIVLLL